MKSLNKIIPYVVYPFDLMISFNETNEKFVKNLEQYGLGHTDDYKLIHLGSNTNDVGRTVMLETNQTILRLNFYPKTCEQYSTLQHEIFHAVDFLMYKIGIKLSRKSDEAYAYMIGYLTKEIYKLI